MAQTVPTGSEHSAATSVCGALHRAYRDRRLYPLGHPTAQESLEALVVVLGRYLEEHGALALEIEEDALVLKTEQVYQREASRDNLAFLMFRDGLRTLTFFPGCEPADLDALVDCLAHADDLVSMEHDLVTALWEKDLQHIEYHVVNLFLGGESVREGMVNALRETVTNRLEAVQSQSISPTELLDLKMRHIKARRYPDKLLQMTPEEIQRAEREVEELDSTTLKDCADVLLEIAAKIPILSSNDTILQSLSSVLSSFLDEADVEGASFIIQHLEQLEVQRLCPAGSAGFVAGDGIASAHIRMLLEEARQSTSERAEEVHGFLASVRKWIAPALLETLTESGDRIIRKTILEILGGEGAIAWQYVEPLLKDSRWYVVRNAVHLATGMGYEEMAYHAGPLLSHTDVRVRREMARALGRLNSSEAVWGLAQALADSDPSVRILAANALGRKGGPDQRALLLARIEDRSFSSLSAEEMEAFLGAYAELAQDKAVPLLNRIWKKSVLSSRPQPLRVAAVMALGRITGSAAEPALQAASKVDDPQIKRAATEAVHRRAKLRTGSV